MADSDSNIFELDRLLELIALMKEHGLVEVDLQQGDQKIRLARAASGEPTVVSPTPIAPTPAAAPVPAEPVGEAVDQKKLQNIKNRRCRSN